MAEATTIERHVKLVKITWLALHHMLQWDGRSLIRMEGLPRDATLLGIWNDEQRAELTLRVGHPSFPEVGDHELPEIVQITATETLVPEEIRRDVLQQKGMR